MRWLPAARPTGREGAAVAFVLVGLAVAVAAVYVVVVLGGGALIGQTDSPNLALSVVATGLVALGFERVQRWLQAQARTRILANQVSPYDVLSRFSRSASGAYSTETVATEMARLLAEGTCTPWAQVWSRVDGRLVLAATWPVGEPGDTSPPDETRGAATRTRNVSLRGEPLGAIRVGERPGQPLSPVEERLFSGLADQAGLVLHGIRLRTELAARAAELQQRAADLRSSRERVVDLQDEERRRLERDIHDGAQQHLVALAVNLRLAQTLAERAPDRAASVLADQAAATETAIGTLLDLARGIYPRALTEDGLEAALRAAVAPVGKTVRIKVGGVPRQPEDVEAAVYFCVLEAVQNAAKHAAADDISVDVTTSDGWLSFLVADDGRGFDRDAATAGDGLANMRDRIDAAGGSVLVASRPGNGTRVEGRVPLRGGPA